MPVGTVNDNMYYALKARYSHILANGTINDYLRLFRLDNPTYMSDELGFYCAALGVARNTVTVMDAERMYWEMMVQAYELLATAELWLDADKYDGGAKWKNQGTGGAVLDAQIGSSVTLKQIEGNLFNASLQEGLVFTSVSNGSLSTITNGALDGSRSRRMTASGSGLFQMFGTGSTYPVLPSTEYTYSVYVKSSIAVSDGFIGLDWGTSGGIYISSNNLSPISFTTEWQVYSVTAVSPSNAAFVYPIVRRTAAAGAGEWVEACMVCIRTNPAIPTVADSTGYGTFIGGGALNLPGVAGNTFSTPDSVGLDITGPIEILGRVQLLPAGYVVIKGTSYSDLSYSIYLNTDNRLHFYAKDSAGNARDAYSTEAFPYIGVYGWFKVTVDPSTASFSFFAAPDSGSEPTNWTQVGTTVTTAAFTGGTFRVNTSVLQHLGFNSMNYKRLIIRNNIGANSAVFDADFSIQPDGTTSFRESANGALVTIVSTYNDTNDPVYLPGEKDGGYVYTPGASGNEFDVPSSASPDTFELIARIDNMLVGYPLGSLQATSSFGIFSDASNAFLIVERDGAGTTVANVGVSRSNLFFQTLPLNQPYWARITRAGGIYSIFLSNHAGTTPPQSWGVAVTSGASTVSGALTTMTTVTRAGNGGSPWSGRYYYLSYATTVGGTPSVIVDFSQLKETDQSTFVCQTGQTVTFNRSATGRKLVVKPVGSRSCWLYGTDDYKVFRQDLFKNAFIKAIYFVIRRHHASSYQMYTAGWTASGVIIYSFGTSIVAEAKGSISNAGSSGRPVPLSVSTLVGAVFNGTQTKVYGSGAYSSLGTALNGSYLAGNLSQLFPSDELEVVSVIARSNEYTTTELNLIAKCYGAV